MITEESIESLACGWEKHHERMSGSVCETLSKNQDPKILVLTCSDSRVEFSHIFGLKNQGEVFQVRNIGGVFSEDAKSGFTYALKHLKPNIIMILHHTGCGGYQSLDQDSVEEEVVLHLLKNKCYRARENVDEYLKTHKLSDNDRLRLIIEEGARIQAARLHGFLNRNYPQIEQQILNHEICLIAAIYDLKTDDIYLVPAKLEKSDKPRNSIFKCLPEELTHLTGDVKPKIQH